MKKYDKKYCLIFNFPDLKSSVLLNVFIFFLIQRLYVNMVANKQKL